MHDQVGRRLLSCVGNGKNQQQMISRSMLTSASLRVRGVQDSCPSKLASCIRGRGLGVLEAMLWAEQMELQQVVVEIDSKDILQMVGLDRSSFGAYY